MTGDPVAGMTPSSADAVSASTNRSETAAKDPSLLAPSRDDSSPKVTPDSLPAPPSVSSDAASLAAGSAAVVTAVVVTYFL